MLSLVLNCCHLEQTKTNIAARCLSGIVGHSSGRCFTRWRTTSSRDMATLHDLCWHVTKCMEAHEEILNENGGVGKPQKIIDASNALCENSAMIHHPRPS